LPVVVINKKNPAQTRERKREINDGYINSLPHCISYIHNIKFGINTSFLSFTSSLL
jgi:hypothetical protein